MLPIDAITTTGNVFLTNGTSSNSPRVSTIRPAYPHPPQEYTGRASGAKKLPSGPQEEGLSTSALLPAQDHMNREIFAHSLHIRLDEETHQITVALVDKATGNIIRRFPLNENGPFNVFEATGEALLVDVYQ